MLVNPDAHFEIMFKYSIVRNNKEEAIGITLLPDDFEGKCEVFQGTFKAANYDQMSSIREDCTVINHKNEKSVLLMKQFRSKVLSAFCLSWNLLGPDGNPIPIQERAIMNMFEHFVAEIFDRWEKTIGSAEVSML
jgi:hypothetical protein